MKNRHRTYIDTACSSCGKPLSVRSDQVKELQLCRSCSAVNKWLNRVYRERQVQAHIGHIPTEATIKKRSASLKTTMKGRVQPHLRLLWEARTKEFGVAAMNSYYTGYQNQARKRKKPFTLTFQEFEEIVLQNCAYCGAPPSVVRKPHPTINGHITVNGVDRKDSSVGYHPGNCAPCCKACNYAKQQMGVDEFASWVRRISTHLETHQLDNTVASREIFSK